MRWGSLTLLLAGSLFLSIAPGVFAADRDYSIPENSANGTVLSPTYTLSGGTSYAITSGNTNSAFSIVAETGVISVANSTALDFETTSTFTLTLLITGQFDPLNNPSDTQRVREVSITLTDVVEAANTDPTAPDYAIAVEKNANHTFAFSSIGASDIDGDTVTLSTVDAISGTTVGTPTKEGGNAIKYSPATDYEGSDSFTYTISDGNGGTATGTISVSVAVPNRAPTAVTDSYAAIESTAYTTTSITGVIANDTDADADALTASLVTNVTHGTLVFSSDGSFTYTADAEFSGTDTFTYKANDGSADSNTATVTFTVSRLPDTDPPVITLLGDASVSLTVNDTFTDPGATATDARDGSVSVSVGGDTINTDVVGTYTLTYSATDAAGNTALPVSRTVTISSGSTGGGGGGGGNSRSSRGGSVLGASTYFFSEALGIGATGAPVTALQEALANEGLYVGPPTGIFDAVTETAVKGYQLRHGITPVSGYVGPKTLAQLNSATAPTTVAILSDEQRAQILAKILELLQMVAALRAELALRGVST